jgi:hypothetical protein
LAQVLSDQPYQTYTSECKQCYRSSKQCFLSNLELGHIQISLVEKLFVAAAILIESVHFSFLIWYPLRMRLGRLDADLDQVHKDSQFSCPYRSRIRRACGLRPEESPESLIWWHFAVAILCFLTNVACSVGKIYPAPYQCETVRCMVLTHNAVMVLSCWAVEFFERRMFFIILIPEDRACCLESLWIRLSLKAEFIGLNLAWISIDLARSAHASPGWGTMTLSALTCVAQLLLVVLDLLIFRKQLRLTAARPARAAIVLQAHVRALLSRHAEKPSQSRGRSSADGGGKCTVQRSSYPDVLQPIRSESVHLRGVGRLPRRPAGRPRLDLRDPGVPRPRGARPLITY